MNELLQDESYGLLYDATFSLNSLISKSPKGKDCLVLKQSKVISID